jgi:hypothetical protein
MKLIIKLLCLANNQEIIKGFKVCREYKTLISILSRLIKHKILQLDTPHNFTSYKRVLVLLINSSFIFNIRCQLLKLMQILSYNPLCCIKVRYSKAKIHLITRSTICFLSLWMTFNYHNLSKWVSHLSCSYQKPKEWTVNYLSSKYL